MDFGKSFRNNGGNNFFEFLDYARSAKDAYDAFNKAKSKSEEVRRITVSNTRSQITGSKFANGAYKGSRGSNRGCGACRSQQDENQPFIAGARSYFEDILRFRFHQQALRGEFGEAERLYALTADLVISTAFKLYWENSTISPIDSIVISLDGETTVTGVINNQVLSSLDNNKEYYIGRAATQLAVSIFVTRRIVPFHKIPGISKFASGGGVGLVNISASTYGRALNLFDNGVRNAGVLVRESLLGSNP